MTRLSIRIDFEEQGGVLGPGMTQLLDRVAQYGSIRQAAVSMAMSYRKAWLLIQAMQETFGGPVVTTATGGASGGGSELTALGRMLVLAYRRVEKRAGSAAQTDLRHLSKIIAANAKPRNAKKRRAI